LQQFVHRFHQFVTDATKPGSNLFYFAPDHLKFQHMLYSNKKGIAVMLAAGLVFFAVHCTTSTKEQPLVKDIAAEPAVSIEKGQRLVTAGGCNDCHSPKSFTPFGPKIDSTRMLSGHPENAPLPKIDLNSLKPGNWVNFSPDLTAIVGPWGMSYTANITSDSATGIGAWTEANFVNAIRKGKHMGMDNGRPIMPPMPWENLNQLSDEELKSIFAFLKSTPPVRNRVHQPFTPDEVVAMKKQEGK
jgi:mono/diheme cytochrome c family protein